MSADPLIIFPHLEMGDNLILNGMCRYFAKREAQVVWAVRNDYAADIRTMFSDLPNVRVMDGFNYPFELGHHPGSGLPRTINLGFFSEEGKNWKPGLTEYNHLGLHWDSEWYKQADVDFNERWNSFSLPSRLIPNRVECSGEILVHEVPERGILISPGLLPLGGAIVRIERTPSFWDWLPKIYNAAELHFVDSAYLNLAESLYALGHLRNTRLVFHEYAKKRALGSVPPVLRAPWEILC